MSPSVFSPALRIGLLEGGAAWGANVYTHLVDRFLKRGGGIVVVHAGCVSGDQNEWCKSIIGGAWRWPTAELPKEKATKWLEGEDGTARGGILVSIAEKFDLPVHYVGVAEGTDDLQPFDAESFAKALVGLAA